MEANVECCAGLDVHQATVVACLNSGAGTNDPQGSPHLRHDPCRRCGRGFSTFGCTLAAMESTGIYWRPVHAALEGHFDLIVGNAQHIKNVPGRRTDVKDCEWISDLARRGLIATSFVPPRPIRDLTRYRRKVSQTQASERNRLIRMLDSAKHQTVWPDQRCVRRFWPGDAAGADRGRGDAGGDGATRARAVQAGRVGSGAGWPTCDGLASVTFVVARQASAPADRDDGGQSPRAVARSRRSCALRRHGGEFRWDLVHENVNIGKRIRRARRCLGGTAGSA